MHIGVHRLDVIIPVGSIVSSSADRIREPHVEQNKHFIRLAPHQKNLHQNKQTNKTTKIPSPLALAKYRDWVALPVPPPVEPECWHHACHHYAPSFLWNGSTGSKRRIPKQSGVIIARSTVFY